MILIFVCIHCKKIHQYGTPLLPGMPIYACAHCVEHGVVKVHSLNEISNIKAVPWKENEVESLNAYQESEHFVPFVCKEHHRLFADRIGLHCLNCDFTQSWSYPWTLDWSWDNIEPPPKSDSRRRAG